MVKSARLKRTNKKIPYMSQVLCTPKKLNDGKVRFAIVQPGSYGDNINSTIMLKPIKTQFNGCEIDVHTSEYYKSAFYNNQYIDNIIAHPAVDKNSSLHLLKTVPPTLQDVGYAHIFVPHPMINPDKWTSIKHGDLGTNLICAWVRAMEEYGIEYNLPLESILNLTNTEVDEVNRFCNSIPRFHVLRKNIIECHAESGQTFWTDDWTTAVVDKLCSAGQIAFLSRRSEGRIDHLKNKYPGLVYFVGALSIRCVAELFNKCDRFISISSGLSNAVNTNWCKKDIEWLEVINSPVVSSAPIRSINKTFWYDNNIQKFVDTISV